MAATYTKEDVLVVETEFKLPKAEVEKEILPWYRRVPAPGISTSRH